VVGCGSGRHLQHRRGEGQNHLAENELETTLIEEGRLRRQRIQICLSRWRGGQTARGGCEGGGGGSMPGLLARARGEVGEHSMTSLH
jgi:hypothetical protein